MRKLLLIISIAAIAVSCSNPEKTITNLKNNLTLEKSESDQYKKITEMAKKDSLFNVAALFEAMTEAKNVRISNCIDILKELEEGYNPSYENVDSEPLSENYILSIQQNFDVKLQSYDTLINTAGSERAKNALNYFSRLKSSDGKINNYLMNAVDAVNYGDDSMVGDEWYVCPVCGDVYRIGDLFDKCDICDTEASKFKKFTAK